MSGGISFHGGEGEDAIQFHFGDEDHHDAPAPAAAPVSTAAVQIELGAKTGSDTARVDAGRDLAIDVKKPSDPEIVTVADLARVAPAAPAKPAQVHEEDTDANVAESDDPNAPIFKQSLKAVSDRLQSVIDFKEPKNSPGLTGAEAKARLLRDGPNELSPPPEKPLWLKYLLGYTDPFMLLLIFAGIMSMIAYGVDTTQPINEYIAIVLWVVTFISTTFTFVQEGKASAVMKSFTKMLPSNCEVKRDGKWISVPARELVVGDLIRVHTGRKVPADARVIQTEQCKVELSSLTGESVPAPIVMRTEAKKLEEARNVLFNTSQVLEGESHALVFATGDRTLVGTIAKMASMPAQETTLQKEIKRFVRRLTSVALIMGIVFFIIGILRHQPWISAFINGFIVVMIANVPEGLPMTVTSCLMITAQRMAQRNVFVKQLQSVETLGSATVIASDKTGTLTQNKMAVAHLWLDEVPMTADTALQFPPSDLAVLQRGGDLLRTMSSSGELRRSDSMNQQQPRRLESMFKDDEGKGGAVVKPVAAPASPTAVAAAPPGLQRQTSVERYGRTKVNNTLSLLELVAGVCNKTRFHDGMELSEEDVSLLEAAESIQRMALDGSSTAISNNQLTLRSAKIAYPGLRRLDSNSNTLKLSGMTLRSGVNKLLLHQREKYHKRETDGEATDKALFEFVHKRRNIELLRYHFPIVLEQAFNSRLKYALNIVKPRNVLLPPHLQTATQKFDQRRKILIKGAPEVILKKCSRYLVRGEQKVIDQEFTEDFNKTYESLGSLGERVLGFGYLELDEKEYPPERDRTYSVELGNFPQKDFVFLGLISLVDPPKVTVPAAVQEVRAAGVKVVMVTGDHPLTAAAIARQVNIITLPTREDIARTQDIPPEAVPEEEIGAIVVRGDEIDKFQQADWDRVLNKEEIVFARTTPHQKLQIVTQLQRLKHIVAVTGDGVNDSPALKKADIGVAMGINGSDVARDAAAVILMDDDFSSIVTGIREGRTIFDNLSKSVAYTVTHLVPELIPTLFNLAFGFPLLLSSLLILCIDLGTELAPAISIAYEPPEGDVMQRPPRDAEKDHLVTLNLVIYSYPLAGVWQTLCCFLAAFIVFDFHGIAPHQIPFSADTYWQSDSPDLVADGGQVWDAQAQQDILMQANTAYWGVLVGSQVFHILMCKTRNSSLLSHGIFNNAQIWAGIFIEIILAIIIVYVPWLNTILSSEPFHGVFWTLIFVGWGGHFLLGEGRKWLGRKFPDSWYTRWFMW